MIQLSLTGKPQAVKLSGSTHPASGISMSLTQATDTFQPRFGNSSLKGNSPLVQIAELYLNGTPLDINALKDSEGNNVLMSLIKAGDWEIAKSIINDPRTTFPASPNQQGASLGHIVAKYGTPELIQLLLQKDPGIVNQVQSYGNFLKSDFDIPAHYTFKTLGQKSDAEAAARMAVNRLVLPGRYDHVTPLTASVICGNRENALAWLAGGANPNVNVQGHYSTDVKNAPGYTDPDKHGAPLVAYVVRAAAFREEISGFKMGKLVHQATLENLLKNKNLDTRIAMLVSVITQNTEALKKILAHPNTDIEGMDSYGRTAFYYAAFCDSDEPMKILLESDKFKELSEMDQKVILMVKGEYADESSATPLEIATRAKSAHPNNKLLLEAEFARLAHIQ